MWLLYHVLGLSAFILQASAEFVPACYVDKSTEALNTSGETQSLVTVNVTAPQDEPLLSAEIFVVPRAECGLDIYFNFPIMLFDMTLQEAEVNCHISTAGFAKPDILKIKTGPKNPDDRYPDVPLAWWSTLSSTVILFRLPKVSAGQVGAYQCYLVMDSLGLGFHVNVSVDVNGCPTGKWGMSCDRDCECVNGATCHSWDGSCRCPKAWKGATCHLENPHAEVETNVTNVYFADPLTIGCSAHGIEVHERNVSWLLNGSNILNGSWALDIPSWRDSGAGTYTCRVVDSFGKAYQDSVDIKSIENPHAEVDTNTTGAYFGDSLTITCSAHGIKVHEWNVRWLLNGSNILNGSWALNIPAWRDSDAGTYTCRVVDNSERVYRDSVDIKNIGCRPGWRGADCNLKCAGCLNEGRCDRFLGCVCGEGWSGDRCEQAVCSPSVHPWLCDYKDHSKTIGLAVGGGILVLVAAAGAFIWCYFRPCQKITITMESELHADCLRSKDIGDLVRNKERLVSEDLGILLAHWQMEESMLYIGKKMGEGYFSSVSAGHVLKGNTLYNVAVKILKDEKDSVSWANFIGEFRILSHICPRRNIVQLVGLCSKSMFDQVVTCLVLEQLASGSLHKVLRDNRKPELCNKVLAPKHYVHIVLDILNGMSHLEELRFVHRDLATRNILLTESLVAKVSDFGLARDAYSTGDYLLEGARGKKLPWKWMAFESLKDGVYTSKSDMWSFGVLLWEMVTLGASPYPGVCNEELLAHLETGKRLERPTSCSRVWYAAMKTCWLEDPDDRPSFRDFLPFFRDHFLLTQTVPFVDPSSEEAEVEYETAPSLPSWLDKNASGLDLGMPDLTTVSDVDSAVDRLCHLSRGRVKGSENIREKSGTGGSNDINKSNVLVEDDRPDTI